MVIAELAANDKHRLVQCCFLGQLHWAAWLPPYLPSAHIPVPLLRVGPRPSWATLGVQSRRGRKRSEKERMQEHRGREGKQVKTTGRMG